MPSSGQLLKVGDASKRLGLSLNQLRLLDKKGHIRTVRTEGNTRLFDVDSYIEKLEADKNVNDARHMVVREDAVDTMPQITNENTPDAQPSKVQKSSTLEDAWKADIEAVFKNIQEKASASSAPFPICFEKAADWIGFTQKAHAKRHLIKNFEEKVDFEFSYPGDKTSQISSGDKNQFAILKTGRPTEHIFLSVECFKAMCMTANTAQGKRVRRYYLDLERRWREGDLTLAGEIVKNYDRVNGTRTNVLIRTSGLDNAHDLPTWVPEWRDARSDQMSRGKTLRDALKELNLSDGSIYGIIENMHNQGVLGFEGTTKQWRRDNGIPEKKPLAEVMDKTQLELRRMMSLKLIELYSSIENPSIAEVKKVAEGVKDRIKGMSEYMGCNEYRATTDEDGNEMYIGKRVRQLEAAHRRSVKRLATIERKQKIMETIPVQVDGHSGAQRRIGDFFTKALSGTA